MAQGIRVIETLDVLNINLSGYQKIFADCIILDQHGKIHLQHRPNGEHTAFGGHVEAGESVTQGLIREIEEELGARIPAHELVYLGSVTEDFTQHQDVVNLFFWHDKSGLITGCYEWEPALFNSVEDVIGHGNPMDYLVWGFGRCKDIGVLK